MKFRKVNGSLCHGITKKTLLDLNKIGLSIANLSSSWRIHTRDGSSTWKMYLSRSPSTFNFVKSNYKSKYSSKIYRQVQVQSTLKFFCQVQSSTSNATFMFHNGEGQSDENTILYYAYACISAVPGIYEENCKKPLYFINNNIHFKQNKATNRRICYLTTHWLHFFVYISLTSAPSVPALSDPD